ncbi:MAG: NAD(P)-dependent oxidoreductase [Alphaproteobacteria bacterium]|nr:NAD(P)-dependent oxidoreductase [Alphaproteobacteria bacterium]
MGALGQILVTGAAGFIGRAIVAQARKRGLPVIAVTRGARVRGWDEDEGIRVLNVDLADADAMGRLRREIDTCETVVHAAAAMSGDPRKHLRDTLTATQMLLAAMKETEAQRLVLLSSIAVYDMSTLSAGETLSETVPVESTDTARDAYVHAKLRQEEMCREAMQAQNKDLWLLRPGAVYGPDRLWNGHLGIGLGPALVTTNLQAPVPVCHVDTCAAAVVSAAQNPSGDLPDVNILDAHLPSRRDYIAALRRAGWPRVVLPVPMSVFKLASLVTAPLGGRRPGLLQPRVLHARMGRFAYDTARQAQRFGAPPQEPFAVRVASFAEAGP